LLSHPTHLNAPAKDGAVVLETGLGLARILRAIELGKRGVEVSARAAA